MHFCMLLEHQTLSLAQEWLEKYPTLAYSLFNPACYGASMLEAQCEKLSQLRTQLKLVFVQHLTFEPQNLSSCPVLWEVLLSHRTLPLGH